MSASPSLFATPWVARDWQSGIIESRDDHSTIASAGTPQIAGFITQSANLYRDLVDALESAQQRLALLNRTGNGAELDIAAEHKALAVLARTNKYSLSIGH
jgi:hypothetical protein